MKLFTDPKGNMQIAELLNFAISHLNNNEKKVTTKLLHVVAGKGIRGHLVQKI